VPGRLARCLPYALVAAAAGWLFTVATQFEFHRRGANLGPDAWPKLVLGLILAICAWEIARIALFGARREVAGVLQEIVEESAREHGDAGTDTEPQVMPRPRLLVAGVGLTALYVWAIQLLGFFLATAPYVALFIALGGYRRWAVNLAVSGLGTLLMMFFFMKVVYVSLPPGRGPFAQFTFWLMQMMGIR
jgi:putative tricarboxylic transport membrane protein